MSSMAIVDDNQRQKALRIALGHWQWQRIALANGQRAWRIPSATERNRWYVVTTYSCSCRAFERIGDCKHSEASRLCARLGLTADVA